MELFGEPIYSITEAAKVTRLSTWTLWDLLKKGRIGRTKIAGHTFIRRSELLRLVKESNVAPGHEQ
jgi:excisionase family DNA binding protein